MIRRIDWRAEANLKRKHKKVSFFNGGFLKNSYQKVGLVGQLSIFPFPSPSFRWDRL